MAKASSFNRDNKTTEGSVNPQASSSRSNAISIPQITLPKSGGAIKSIDDKFSVNAVNGTAAFSIPFPLSSSRNGFMPAMTLSYNSGSGNGVFGLGWNAEPAFIARKTEKKLPEYNDATESDTFIFSGVEDLVPSFSKDDNDNWIKEENEDGSIKKYKPRIEGSFSRIEKITETNGNVYWKVTSKDNIVSVFGKSKSARLFNPVDESKIFKWFLEFSYDDKGNCFRYEYVKEDKINVPGVLYEKNRLNDLSVCTNVYLKKIKYCNKGHLHRSAINFSDWENSLSNIEFLLELVLDYGEHDLINPQPDDNNGWSCRPDPFSEYLPGFEIRTWRICRRLLMFHHFIELGNRPCLVRSLDIEYDQNTAFSFLKSVTQKGFIRKVGDTYSEKSFPSVEFTYEKLGWDTTVKTLSKESLENLPVGIDDRSYQWIDLYNEGLSGILTEQADGWYYKRNSGNGKFDPVKLVSPKPAMAGLNSDGLHFQDLEANGLKQLVSNGLDGFYEFTDEEEWLPFKNFKEVVNLDLQDPNVKLLDLNGDGKADILISGENIFTWYASKGKDGFDNHRTTLKTFEEEEGPNVVFADSSQSIVLADMSGDGLIDIVRIRNNDIVYWPNLGYGKFGAKVQMSNAPNFDQPDHFNPQYIKLADLDGSGVTDIVYLGKDSFKIYFNQAGNSWSEENIVQGVNPLPFPKIDNTTSINIIDLLGNGTGCIAWSSPLPANSENPLRYIDLMGGKKPHIMTSYKNNMGKEVIIHYRPSTYFYLEDKKNGTPWITKLPFPVQCVSDVEIIDHIRKTRFTNQYSYHHAYYDHKEREFRGFGRVDQTDTEDYENYKKNAIPGGDIQLVDERFHMPATLTRTWFHTGAFLDKEKILDQFAHEYFRNEIVPEKILSEPMLPDDWSTSEWQEALRACKGMPLHAEVYSLDEGDKKDYPYTTAHHTCLIQRHQPTLNNKHAVFIVQENEALVYNYDRDPADPRIAHSMNIEVDEFGNVLKSAAISYGRKTADNSLSANEQAVQSKTHIVFTENNFSNDINTASDYRLPAGFETMTYELTGLSAGNDGYFSIDQLKNDFQTASVIAYQVKPTVGLKQKRVIEHVYSLFFDDNLIGPLPRGIIQPLLLPYEAYQLALTHDLVQDIFGNKISDQDQTLVQKGKYKQDNNNYWIASGTQTFDPAHFYHVTEVADPFNNKTTIGYCEYDFYVKQTIDPLGNKTEVTGFNFRTLSPYLLTDMNDNRSGMRMDELGMPATTFIMGKTSENKGDLMYTTKVEISETDEPTTRLEYNLFNFISNGKPNFTKTIIRETHHFESLQSGKPVIWQTAWSYSDGGGNEVMRKVQAEPGEALQENEDGTVATINTNQRWIGNGRTILNNKGKPVKQYEPYFSTTYEYEDSKLLVERGVTIVIHYDPLGRVIKTEMPDGTFSKVEFDSWKQKTYDPIDTVLDSKWYESFGSPNSNDPKPAGKNEQAAWLSAILSDTPLTTHLDSLGRPFVTVQHNRTYKIDEVTKMVVDKVDHYYPTFTELDIEGDTIKVIDACNNTVMSYKYDMLGHQVYQNSMDAGERWLLNDCMGKPTYAWDSKGQRFETEYDDLHRPLTISLIVGNSTTITDRFKYCDTRGLSATDLLANQSKNLVGKLIEQYDSAGKIEMTEYDFKGNLLNSSRQLCKDYDAIPHWPEQGLPPMQDEIFYSSTEFDALNRPEKVFTPWTEGTDNIPASEITPEYNEANLLNGVKAKIRGSTVETEFVANIEYDEKGQRKSIRYGNQILTEYTYDEKTFRITRLLTTKGTQIFQDLYYTYDAVGNITHVFDNSHEAIFFNNNRINALSEYYYDAIYQLIYTKGREHIAQNNINETRDYGNHNGFNYRNFSFDLNLGANDAHAVRDYRQYYVYDAVGNILQMQHSAGLGSWTRKYWYNNNDAQRNELGVPLTDIKNNRLLQTQVGTGHETGYRYDVHGNMLNPTDLPDMIFNHKDQLQYINLVGGGEAYYIYDSSGQRIRKVVKKNGIEEERIYLGSFEIFRKQDNSGDVVKQVETLHIMDDSRRIAMVDTPAFTDDDEDEQVIRYIYSNHLGSSSLELNENAITISYEEYHPYGTTSLSVTNTTIRAAAKRYRYTGMERDKESGMAYHTARYYLPWLGRWLNVDPIHSYEDGVNFYAYVKCKPLDRVDMDGCKSKKPLNINIRIASSQEVFKNPNLSGGAVLNIDPKLRSRFVDQIKRRLSFLNIKDEMSVTVSFGRFNKNELKVPGNVQVWLVPEVDVSSAPADILRKQYGYQKSQADAIAEEFKDVVAGPGRDARTSLGGTPKTTALPLDSPTAVPVFIKLPELFIAGGRIRTETSDYQNGQKQAAEFRVDEIATTTLHELGHAFGLEHVMGDFRINPKTSTFRKSYPPRLMDTESGRGTQGGIRRADEPSDILTPDDVDLLGWGRVLSIIGDPILRQIDIKNGGIRIWFNDSVLEFSKEEKESITKFLKDVQRIRSENEQNK